MISFKFFVFSFIILNYFLFWPCFKKLAFGTVVENVHNGPHLISESRCSGLINGLVPRLFIARVTPRPLPQPLQCHICVRTPVSKGEPERVNIYNSDIGDRKSFHLYTNIETKTHSFQPCCVYEQGVWNVNKWVGNQHQRVSLSGGTY